MIRAWFILFAIVSLIICGRIAIEIAGTELAWQEYKEVTKHLQ